MQNALISNWTTQTWQNNRKQLHASCVWLQHDRGVKWHHNENNKSNNTKQVFNITNNSRSILVGLRSQLTHSLGSSISPYCLLICFKCCFVRQLNGFGLNISYRPSNTHTHTHTHTLTPIQNIQRKEWKKTRTEIALLYLNHCIIMESCWSEF